MKFVIFSFLSLFLFGCGEKVATKVSSTNGYPAVSVKCGSQSCVK